MKVACFITFLLKCLEGQWKSLDFVNYKEKSWRHHRNVDNNKDRDNFLKARERKKEFIFV